jgi:hypothetical protein|tara:strand:- start:81 stop:311 length:231 start_codon:yes stop_codon:yes gene_type:complete
MPNYRIISTPEHPNGQVVQFTEAEEAQRVADIAAAKIRQDAIDAAAAQKATDKTNGNQKLLDLGLTQAEVDALTGK